MGRGNMNTIKKRCRDIGKSLGQVSRETGISRHHLSNIVNDKATPKIDTAYKIARALECNIEDLWSFEE